MKPKGTIYQRGKSARHGEIFLILPWFLKVVFQILRGVGAGMVAFAVILFMFSYGPILSQEINYNLRLLTTGGKSQAIEAQKVVADEIVQVQKEASSYNVTSYFAVAIPKIDAYSNIISNVDTNNKTEYTEALQKGVAHAKGTYFPGQNGRIFLFSHSTDTPANFSRYNAIFYLLRKLEKGDQIVIFFADKKYIYEVSEKVITTPVDSTWLHPEYGEEQLVLMTCDPPGTTWNRLMVIAKPFESS